MLDILNIIGAVGTVIMGLLGLLRPQQTADLVGLTSVTPAGRSEFRATFGGLFVALGLTPLIIGAPLLFALAGLCWLGAALGRIVSIILDKPRSPKNWAGVGFEGVFAALLLVGEPLTSLL